VRLGFRLEVWGVDTSIILKVDIKKIRRDGVDQIYLPPDNDKLWTPLKPVMNF